MLIHLVLIVFSLQICFGQYRNYYERPNNIYFHNYPYPQGGYPLRHQYWRRDYRYYDNKPRIPSYYRSRNAETYQEWLHRLRLWQLNRKVSFQNKRLLKMRDVVGGLVQPDDVGSKVDGGFGAWSDWSSCSNNCGLGVQSRERLCNKPHPQNGGKNCQGNSEGIKSCVGAICEDSKETDHLQEMVLRSLESFEQTLLFWNNSGISNTNHSFKSLGVLESSKLSKNSTKSKQKIVFESRYHKSIFIMQQIIAQEILSNIASPQASALKKHLNILEKKLFAAAHGGSYLYAHKTLAQCIYTFVQLKITEDVDVDEITKVTKQFLIYVQAKIGIKAMGHILSSSQDTTVMMVIDRTGYAIDNLAPTIEQITSKKRTYDVDYILSLFDRGVSAITHHISGISATLKTYRHYCHQAGFQAMISALYASATPPKFGSQMFVFTDSLILDGSAINFEQLKTAAKIFGVKINVFSQPYRGCSGDIEMYKKIADATAGNYLNLAMSETKAFKEYIGQSLSGKTLIVAKRYVNGGRDHSVSIEPSIKKLWITANVARHASHVKLMAPNGLYVDFTTGAYKRITTHYVILFEISNPQRGKWWLHFPIVVGNFKFTVEAITNQPIEFSVYFNQKEATGNSSSLMVLQSPFKETTSTMSLQIGGINHIYASSIKISIQDENGRVMMSNLPIKSGRLSNIYKIKFLTPRTTFRVALTGKMKDGYSFQRISEVIYPISSYLQHVNSGEDSEVAIIGGQKVPIKLRLINRGVDETYVIYSAVSLGSVSIGSFYMGTKRYGYKHTIEFTPPQAGDHYHGKIARLTLTGYGKTTGEALAQTIEILLLKS